LRDIGAFAYKRTGLLAGTRLQRCLKPKIGCATGFEDGVIAHNVSHPWAWSFLLCDGHLGGRSGRVAARRHEMMRLSVLPATRCEKVRNSKVETGGLWETHKRSRSVVTRKLACI